MMRWYQWYHFVRRRPMFEVLKDLHPKTVRMKVAKLRPGLNLREQAHAKADSKLLLSLKEIGHTLERIWVRNAWPGEDTNFKYVVDGHRRLDGLIKDEIEEVEVDDYQDITEEQALKLSMVHNLQRKSMSSAEKIKHADALLKLGESSNSIARHIGGHRGDTLAAVKVAKKGSERLKKAVEAGNVTLEAAGKIADMPKQTQRTMLPKVVGGGSTELSKNQKKSALRLPTVIGGGKNKFDTEENRRRIIHRSRAGVYDPNFKLLSHLKFLIQDFAWYAQDKYREYPKNLTYQAYIDIAQMLIGKVKMSELFPDAVVPEYEMKFPSAVGKKKFGLK
jgi:ParB-like chromosome segregation protein Spo0J